jgi:S-adenosylmethionine-dependent methyltransferase
MPHGIEDYYDLVHQPWGRIFYDILWRQLVVEDKMRLKILDFGSGFGVTSNHFAAKHDVTAVEPNIEMSGRRFSDYPYQQITAGYEKLRELPAEMFDVIFCHNVLEYAENKEEIFAELARLLKKDGILSIVKHNRFGRAMAAAVFDDNPEKALALIDHQKTGDEQKEFGTQNLYDDETLFTWAREQHLSVEKILGIRSFFALSRNNDVKFTPEWYSNMLELELIASNMEEYKGIAFFHHVIFRK